MGDQASTTEGASDPNSPRSPESTGNSEAQLGQSTSKRLLAEIVESHLAHARLIQRLERLTDDEVRADSTLPGWSRGHVLTHLARQGDSVVRRLLAAAENQTVDQYGGGQFERNREIEAGALRSALEIVDDLAQSISAVDEVFRKTPEVAWGRPVRSVDGSEAPARSLVLLRWQEVEIHHVDLDLGYSPSEWPSALVDTMLPTLTSAISERADQRALLAWLIGRGPAPALEAWD